jgi:transposase-like protein
MSKRSPFRYFKSSPDIIRLAVMLYIRFPLSLRNDEDLLHERGIEISHETAKFWQTDSVRCLPLKSLRRVHKITRALM